MLISAWTPNVSKREESIEKLVTIERVKGLGCLVLLFAILLTLFTFLLLILVLAVCVKVFPDNSLELVSLEARSENHTNLHEDFEIILPRNRAVSLNVTLVSDELLDGINDDLVGLEAFPLAHVFSGVHVWITIIIVGDWVLGEGIPLSIENKGKTR